MKSKIDHSNALRIPWPLEMCIYQEKICSNCSSCYDFQSMIEKNRYKHLNNYTNSVVFASILHHRGFKVTGDMKSFIKSIASTI